MSSLKIIPGSGQVTQVSTSSFGPQAPSVPALQDAMRTGEPTTRISSKVNNRHPLEARISNWDKTQRDTQLETYRRIFGAADPIKRTMELKIVEDSSFKPVELLGNDGFKDMQKDILLNKESNVDWEDIYTDDLSASSKKLLTNDFHSAMEKKFGI